MASICVDISVLQSHKLASGYRNVYRHKNGWQARPYRRRVVGTFRTPELAAAAVVTWWEATYGPEWRTAYRKRSCNGWRLSYDSELCGYVLTVWPYGVPELLAVFPTPGKRTRREYMDLKKHCRKHVVGPWARKKFGLLAGCSLWRGTPLKPSVPVMGKLAYVGLRRGRPSYNPDTPLIPGTPCACCNACDTGGDR